MYLSKALRDVRAIIIVRDTAKERLRTKCFRGSSMMLAGNFLRWDSVEEVFSDYEVMKYFLAELEEVWSKKDYGTHSVNFTCSTPVGWESTAPRQNYSENDLEQFNLNHRSHGLRVKRSQTNLLAPRTCELTIIYEFKTEGKKVIAVVHSLYPGSDVGELRGNVTEREQRIFFDFNHPGA